MPRGLIDKQLPAGLHYVKGSSGSFSATEPYGITVSGAVTLPHL